MTNFSTTSITELATIVASNTPSFSSLLGNPEERRQLPVIFPLHLNGGGGNPEWRRKPPERSGDRACINRKWQAPLLRRHSCLVQNHINPNTKLICIAAKISSYIPHVHLHHTAFLRTSCSTRRASLLANPASVITILRSSFVYLLLESQLAEPNTTSLSSTTSSFSCVAYFATRS